MAGAADMDIHSLCDWPVMRLHNATHPRGLGLPVRLRFPLVGGGAYAPWVGCVFDAAN
jgi:hypothetical protein